MNAAGAERKTFANRGLQPMNVAAMTIRQLLQAQHSVNAYFVRRRDRGLQTEISYARLKAIETELNRRHVCW